MSPAGSLRFQAWRLRDTLRDRLRGTAHRREIFTRIYAGNLLGDGNSVSGHGSNLEATAAVRDALPGLFESRHPIRSRRTMRRLPLDEGRRGEPRLLHRHGHRCRPGCTEHGSLPVAERHVPLRRYRRRPAAARRSGAVPRLLHSPAHAPDHECVAELRRERCPYLLLTNSATDTPYHDIPVGSFRAIDFGAAPFHFPEPIRTIAENTDGSRTLCLWELQTLRRVLETEAKGDLR